jgi:hypothetical protein
MYNISVRGNERKRTMSSYQAEVESIVKEYRAERDSIMMSYRAGRVAERYGLSRLTVESDIEASLAGRRW